MLHIRYCIYGEGWVRTDDIKSQIIIPRQTIKPNPPPSPHPPLPLLAFQPLQPFLIHPIPFSEQLPDVEPDVGFELEYGFLGEDVRDDFAFTGVFGAGAGVEEAAGDGDECVVEVGFEGAGAVGVDGLESGGVVYGDVVWGEADECACGGERLFSFLFLFF